MTKWIYEWMIEYGTNGGYDAHGNLLEGWWMVEKFLLLQYGWSSGIMSVEHETSKCHKGNKSGSPHVMSDEFRVICG